MMPAGAGPVAWPRLGSATAELQARYCKPAVPPRADASPCPSLVGNWGAGSRPGRGAPVGERRSPEPWPVVLARARKGPLAQPWTPLTEALGNFALSQDWRLKP